MKRNSKNIKLLRMNNPTLEERKEIELAKLHQEYRDELAFSKTPDIANDKDLKEFYGELLASIREDIIYLLCDAERYFQEIDDLDGFIPMPSDN